MGFKQSITKFLKLLPLFLFIGYYSGVTLFFHIHIVNGQVIAHSHFYKSESGENTPVKKHAHPSSTYVVIHQLSNISSDDLVVVSPYEHPFLHLQSIFRCSYTTDTYLSTTLSKPSRGPPVC